MKARVRPLRYRRGRPLPALRHGDVLDLTTWPLGSSPRGRRKIARCPNCGKKGEVATNTLTNGNRVTRYTHSTRFETLFWMEGEHCSTVEGASA